MLTLALYEQIRNLIISGKYGQNTVMDFWEDSWTLAPLYVHYSHYSDKNVPLPGCCCYYYSWPLDCHCISNMIDWHTENQWCYACRIFTQSHLRLQVPVKF